MGKIKEVLIDAETLGDTLETFIDRYSLGSVIEIVAGICQAKADHLRANWQDENAAREWEIDAETIGEIVLINAPDREFWKGAARSRIL